MRKGARWAEHGTKTSNKVMLCLALLPPPPPPGRAEDTGTTRSRRCMEMQTARRMAEGPEFMQPSNLRTANIRGEGCIGPHLVDKARPTLPSELS